MGQSARVTRKPLSDRVEPVQSAKPPFEYVENYHTKSDEQQMVLDGVTKEIQKGLKNYITQGTPRKTLYKHCLTMLSKQRELEKDVEWYVDGERTTDIERVAKTLSEGKTVDLSLPTYVRKLSFII